FQSPDELLKAIPTITDAIDARKRVTRQSVQKIPPAASHAVTRNRPGRLAPKRISIARLPVTGSDVFGREEEITFLDRAWANKDVNVVTIVAWAGELSGHLAHDVRQGAHARKVMESYQTWFGKGPELSVLRMLGLFDRPADEKVLGALLKSPPIPDLTESLTDLSPTEWRTILARLRRARLLAREDPHNPGHLDTHPLVREYFGEQLRNQRTEAWKECNRRLYNHYRTLAPETPDSFREMEPLFLAVICGCNAGLFRNALHEVYIPRIQRGNASFAAKVLGSRGALLSVLIHFFEGGRWGSPVHVGVKAQSLTAEDQLFVLMQAGLYLTLTRGLGAPEARICYEHAEPFCHSLNRPLLLYSGLMGQWVFSLVTDKLSAAMQIAKRVYALAQEQHDSALMIGAYRALAVTLYFLGDFESARQYAMCGLQIWRSG